MLGALAALALNAAPVALAPAAVTELVLQAKKKKKGKEKEKDKEKDKPSETSEGIDLTQPEAAPAPAESAEPSPVAEEAAAPEKKSEASAWSLMGPHTVGESANVVEAGVGWPGVYAGYWRGILQALDVGAKVGFNWGYEGVLTQSRLGLRFQVQARYLLVDTGSISLGVSFSPGAIVYFFPVSGARPGVILPLAATLGLPNFVEKLNVSVTLELSFFALANQGWGLPIVAGANAEYFISDALVVFAKVRPLGIAIFPNGIFYAFEANAGVGYHL